MAKIRKAQTMENVWAY